MGIQLLTPDNIVMELNDLLPATSIKKGLIAGASCKSLKNDFIEILMQEVEGVDFGLRISTGQLFNKIKAAGNYERPGLYGTFMFSNGVRKDLNKLGKYHLRSDFYSLCLGGNIDYTCTIEQEGPFQILDVFFSSGLVEQLKEVFPRLRGILGSRKNTLLGDKTTWILPSLKEIYHQIVNAHFGDEASRRYYLELKMREFLFQLLHNAFVEHRSHTSSKFTKSEIVSIYKAKEILEQHIDRKPPTLRELCWAVGINEFKLKSGFKSIFNASVFTWFNDKRLIRAKELILNTNMELKEISFEVGFPFTTNFVVAFKKRFGVTPGSLRRRRKS